MAESEARSIVPILDGSEANLSKIKEFYPTPESTYPDLDLATFLLAGSGGIEQMRDFKDQIPKDKFLVEEFWRGSSPFQEETERYLEGVKLSEGIPVPVRWGSYPTVTFGVRFWNRPPVNLGQLYHRISKEVTLQATPVSLIFQAGSFHQLHLTVQNEEQGSVQEKIKEEIMRYRSYMDWSRATAEFQASENTSS